MKENALQAQPRPRGGVRMAMLMSQYPAISHTFLLAEVLGLRREGFHVETVSINPPDRPLHELPPAEAEEARTTKYLKSGFAAQMLRLAGIMLRHPVVVLRGVAASMQYGAWDLGLQAWGLAYLAEGLLLGDWMRRRKLDHLHIHFGSSVATVGYLGAKAWKIPYSMTMHGPNEYFDMRAYRLLTKFSAAEFVISISDFGRWNAMFLLPSHQWHKVRVCRLGIYPEKFESVARPQPGEDRELHLLCVGRLVPDKGQRILLRAVKALHQQGMRFRLTLVGRGIEREALEQYASAHQLPVTFTGALDHDTTLALVQTADVFVLPSFAEGIPIALMEAMAACVPCVSTTACGIPELIRHGEDGLLVPPGDESLLAESLRRLLLDEALRAQLGEAGRRRVLADYNLEENIPRKARLLEEMLADARHGRRRGA
uniref:Colanic acid biosynthesis glycosyltransferase WcaL n=1 Tax=Acidobacterium capsulatum TaxID=33075 RepID=A0A7V4XU29_9BACT